MLCPPYLGTFTYILNNRSDYEVLSALGGLNPPLRMTPFPPITRPSSSSPLSSFSCQEEHLQR